MRHVGLELLVTCLNSFDEKEAEESQAVHNVLAVLENFLEVPRIRPQNHEVLIATAFNRRLGIALVVADKCVCVPVSRCAPQLVPTIADDMFEKTRLLKWLLTRLRVREFDANKLYASELLSMYLQARAPGWALTLISPLLCDIATHLVTERAFRQKCSRCLSCSIRARSRCAGERQEQGEDGQQQRRGPAPPGSPPICLGSAPHTDHQ